MVSDVGIWKTVAHIAFKFESVASGTSLQAQRSTKSRAGTTSQKVAEFHRVGSLAL